MVGSIPSASTTQRHADMALDVLLAGAHDRKADDKDQLFGLAVQPPRLEVCLFNQLVGSLGELEVLLYRDLVVVEDVASLLDHLVYVSLFLFLTRHAYLTPPDPFSHHKPVYRRLLHPARDSPQNDILHVQVIFDAHRPNLVPEAALLEPVEGSLRPRWHAVVRPMIPYSSSSRASASRHVGGMVVGRQPASGVVSAPCDLIIGFER